MIPAPTPVDPALRGLIEGFTNTKQPVRWPVRSELLSSDAVVYRDNFAQELAKKPVPQIIQSYVYLTVAGMERLLRLAHRHLLACTPNGIGLELGAGCGLLASLIARQPEVQAVLAVEICEQMATQVIPKVSSHILGRNVHKVIPVFGSFDALQLPDASVDFIVEIDSLHHAGDLGGTVLGCARVLKPGGWMLCLDRCHPNSVTDEDVERMLSEVYSHEFLVANAYPPDLVLTRRENGEHEYRLFEWLRAFRAAGLKVLAIRRFLKQVPLRLAAKGCVRMLPLRVRRWLYRTENADLRTTLRWLTQWLARPRVDSEFGRPILAPKEAAAFLLGKL